MPLPNSIGRCPKSGKGNNQGRQRTTPHDNWCSNRKDSHSKSNTFSSPVISVSPPLNNSDINLPQLSSVGQQSSRSSQNTPRDNWCFNCKESNSNRNYWTSLVISVLPPLYNSVLNPSQMSEVRQQSSRSSHNTTHELQDSSIPSWTSPNPSNTVPPLSTNI